MHYIENQNIIAILRNDYLDPFTVKLSTSQDVEAPATEVYLKATTISLLRKVFKFTLPEPTNPA